MCKLGLPIMELLEIAKAFWGITLCPTTSARTYMLESPCAANANTCSNTIRNLYFNSSIDMNVYHYNWTSFNGTLAFDCFVGFKDSFSNKVIIVYALLIGFFRALWTRASLHMMVYQ